ncbi:MAG: hypothetical protein JXB45_01660 [Candidatus Krumholzibacteriota bacterium]|nr:hypothetical protein [Candidatus Krumholzibacteriota bacterium]
MKLPLFRVIPFVCWLLVPPGGVTAPAPGGDIYFFPPDSAPGTEEASAGDRLGEYAVKPVPGSPFIIYYHRRLGRMAAAVEEILLSSAPEIASGIGLRGIDTIRVFINADRKSYQSLHRGAVPEWGEAFSSTGDMIMGLNAEGVLKTSRPLRTVIRHELSHLFFAQKVRGARCPFWLLEGWAMKQADEWTLIDQWNLISSVLRKDLPDLSELEGPFPPSAQRAGMAYRLSYSAVEYLLGDRPEDIIILTAFLRDWGDFDRAFQLTFGLTPDDFAAEFHVWLRKKYGTTGLLIQVSPFWVGLVVLFLAAYVSKRIRSARKLKEMESALDR